MIYGVGPLNLVYPHVGVDPDLRKTLRFPANPAAMLLLCANADVTWLVLKT